MNSLPVPEDEGFHPEFERIQLFDEMKEKLAASACARTVLTDLGMVTLVAGFFRQTPEADRSAMVLMEVMFNAKSRQHLLTIKFAEDPPQNPPYLFLLDHTSIEPQVSAASVAMLRAIVREPDEHLTELQLEGL